MTEVEQTVWQEDSLRAQARVDAHGLAAARRPKGASGLRARVAAARAALDALVRKLDALPKPDYANADRDPLLVLRENPRLLRSALNEVASGGKVLNRLPRLPLAPGEAGEGLPRIAEVARGYFRSTGWRWDVDALRIYIDEIQKTEPLELQELWSLSSLMKFALMEQAVSAGEQVFTDGIPPVRSQAIDACMKSLRELGYADWSIVAEPLIPFDPLLREDPAGAYARMDFQSREGYRMQVAALARYADLSEVEVAQEALKLARAAHSRPPAEASADPRVHWREAHIGFWLWDSGAARLAEAVGYRPPVMERIRIAARRDADLWYIAPIEVLSILLIAALLLPIVPAAHNFWLLAPAFLLLFLPATQGVVDLMNNAVTALFEARSLPKLNFRKTGIPEDCATLVAVPTLLLNEKGLRELVADLEVRWLANRDPNLHFALITDLPDSVAKPRDDASDPLVALAIELIDELDNRYKGERGGRFLLFHRHRIFNARQGVWMGWERKRGKLLDLNKYLESAYDAFPVKAGGFRSLKRVRYIITLDSDTQLPRGTAAAMVGAMAHPLNQAIIDPERRIVTAGYGILQPRVGVSVHSASRSRLAALFSGQTGFDIYTRAVSDVYQDLYGEGIFTGKGIYEASTLHAVLDRRFPRNALLSHDLIEGAYARAGLATDIEVVDDYPSHYSAYTKRKHRWVRGDWQIAQWISNTVPDEAGRKVRNPISTISRWKIFDNLRRSLVEPGTLLLLLAGWLGLVGGPLYWTLVTVFLMFLPTVVQFCFSFVRALASDRAGAVGEALEGTGQAAFITLLNIVFLPHSTFLSLDAIVRALVRRFFTGQKLLEWETAAEAESGKRTTPVDWYLKASPLFALLVALVLLLRQGAGLSIINGSFEGWHDIGPRIPFALLVALPILVLWSLAGVLTSWLNAPPAAELTPLEARDQDFLREQALRIWRYFLQFGDADHHYMIPDNVEEEGLHEAARVSPTNLGLLLNARQAAVEFGWLTAPEFAELTLKTLATFERLPKYRGHLYNWYRTDTLEPLRPVSVSSVDSGNFAASLYTLRAGAAELLRRPLISQRLFDGMRTQAVLAQLREDYGPTLDAGLAWSLAQTAPPPGEAEASEAGWWRAEHARRAQAVAALAAEYQPWLLPEFLPVRAQLGLEEKTLHPDLGRLPGFARELAARLAAAPPSELNAKLQAALGAALPRLEALVGQVRRCSEESFRLASAMDFGFLVRRDREMLSIGYEVEREELHQACYDMLASEARIAAYIAVSTGEMDQTSWFKMGRTHTLAYGHPVLLSWTATMFEYLMPSLWMRTLPDTLMARTLEGVVAIQQAYGRKLRLPWGISESGYAELDDAGHYHYQAFGIPEIALKWDATAGPVVSPYSSFLALGIDRAAALKNLRAMAKSGWGGAFGLYEAVDYQNGRERPRIVREWMAHHQGMSLLALLNLLHDDACKRWFQANPHLQAAELLLHEKPVREAALKEEVRNSPKKSPVPA